MAILHPIFYPNHTSHHCFLPDSNLAWCNFSHSGRRTEAHWGSWGRDCCLVLELGVFRSWGWRLEFQQNVSKCLVCCFENDFFGDSGFWIMWDISWGFRHWKLLMNSESSTGSCEPRCLAARDIYSFIDWNSPRQETCFFVKRNVWAAVSSCKISTWGNFFPLWSKRIWFHFVRHKWWSPQWEMGPQNSMHLSELFLTSLLPRVKVIGQAKWLM